VLVPVADGIAVQCRALTTLCQSLDIRPEMFGANAKDLPSPGSSGQIFMWRSASGRAEVTCNGFKFECTKLVLAGPKNRLEVIPGAETLLVRTRHAEIRAAGGTVRFGEGFGLGLEMTTPGDKADLPQTIRLAQQP
jgi:hypothetical protein